MEQPECYQYLRGCKDQCNRLVALLYKNRQRDTFGLLSTVAQCNRILLRCLDQCKEHGNLVDVPENIWRLGMLFKTLIEGLKGLQLAFEKLLNDVGAFSRLTRTRTIRKLENVHSYLFQQLQLLEKQLDLNDVEHLMKKTSDPSLPPCFEEDALNFWYTITAAEAPIPTSVLSEAIIEKGRLSVNYKTQVTQLLDQTQQGKTSLLTFVQFLRMLGPWKRLQSNIDFLCNEQWFHGHISSEEATRSLAYCGVGTFLIRLSHTQPGDIVVTFVTRSHSKRTCCHIRVEPKQIGQLHVKEYDADEIQSSEHVFSELSEVMAHYSKYLLQPLSPSLSQLDGFHGHLSPAEAKEILTDHPVGSYLSYFPSLPEDTVERTLPLFPISLHPEYLIGLSVITKDDPEEMVHRTVQVDRTGFTLQGSQITYTSLSELVAQCESLPLNYAITHSDRQVAKRMSSIFSFQEKPHLSPSPVGSRRSLRLSQIAHGSPSKLGKENHSQDQESDEDFLRSPPASTQAEAPRKSPPDGAENGNSDPFNSEGLELAMKAIETIFDGSSYWKEFLLLCNDQPPQLEQSPLREGEDRGSWTHSGLSSQLSSLHLSLSSQHTPSSYEDLLPMDFVSPFPNTPDDTGLTKTCRVDSGTTFEMSLSLTSSLPFDWGTLEDPDPLPIDFCDLAESPILVHDEPREGPLMNQKPRHQHANVPPTWSPSRTSHRRAPQNRSVTKAVCLSRQFGKQHL